MGTRNIRKARARMGQVDLPEPEEPEEFQPHFALTSAFSGVVLSSSSNSEPEQCSEEDEEPPPVAPKKRNNKKKYKKKRNRQSAEKDIDELVAEVNQLVGEPSQAEVQPTQEVQKEPSVIKVQLKHINVENEMQRVFGVDPDPDKTRNRTRSRLTKHRIIYRQPRMQAFAARGLRMSLIKNKDGVKYFKFEHSNEYIANLRETLISLWPKYHSNDNDVNVLIESTAEAALENCATYFLMDVIQPACQGLEDIICFMEDHFHPNFALADENVRLLYLNVENRVFLIAVLMHLHVLTNRACHRTALELAKLLLNLDPSDPLAIIFIIDMVALRAREHKWFIKLYENWAESRQAKELFNMMYSYAMSMFHVATKNKDAAAMEEADNLLQNAILMYPYVVVYLMTAVYQNNPTVTNCPLFSEAESKTPSNLIFIMQLHVKFISDKWKEPEVWKWFMKNTLELVRKYDEDSAIRSQSRSYAFQNKFLYRYLPMEFKRHVSIITPMSELLFDNFTPGVRKTLSFNPYPTGVESDDPHRYYLSWHGSYI